ncbi:tRNA (guanine(46)-N(7))-methyltransferase TrmB [Candidatus Clavichlamydia salmonicola]|uniref:tRNA (guanine(46)-N(7))-methyltransferase TrmB n=1 Tax=Candidatus Clavichlamydia salmonicola TaxID=469812 RepID=UPI001891AF34|nr:tRNA (guanine(46)-N(7))-methyltransferase TrmB [Candidatus Clavichlamydia salmonicola]
MRPSGLTCPFIWKDRQPLFSDRVLFVPEYYDQHTAFLFPDWDDPVLFGNSHPVEMELCSGNGDWVIEKAKQNSYVNWVAVEIRFDRIRKIWSKMKNAKLNNVILVCGDAFTFLTHYLKRKSINNLWINFPDPWPKRRHAKNRIMRPEVIQMIKNALVNDGNISLATDDYDCLTQTIALYFSAGLKPIFTDPYFLEAAETYGNSWFEKLWREKGRKIYYTIFKNSTMDKMGYS